MQGPGAPSLDQLKVFLTVVEMGSFAAAGRRLGRATSAISYAIANLELQLGVPLFDRERTRKPSLTEAGMAVLSDARTVSAGVDNLRAKVKGLADGLEAEVTLVVDVLLPTARLVDAMQAFEAEFPTVALRMSAFPSGSSGSRSAAWSSSRSQRRAIRWPAVASTRRERRAIMCSSC